MSFHLGKGKAGGFGFTAGLVSPKNTTCISAINMPEYRNWTLGVQRQEVADAMGFNVIFKS